MSENSSAPETHHDDRSPEVPSRPETGVADVDEVMRSLEELEGRPVEEHVGVFETAHERLRRALDTP